MGEFEHGNNDGKRPLMKPQRAMKLSKKLKPEHWALLGEIRAATANDEVLEVFEPESKLRARKLANFGFVDLIEEPGEAPGYEITELGKQALHDAGLKGWF